MSTTNQSLATPATTCTKMVCSAHQSSNLRARIALAEAKAQTREQVGNVPKPKGSGQDVGQQFRVKCTYQDCQQRFDNEKDMRRHKKSAPEHDYCKKCDVDCESYEDLVQHKVTIMDAWWRNRRSYDKSDPEARGPKHITCEFCGQDFESFGGRKDHRLQMHPADQDLRCPGCEGLFTRAGNMIAHLEDGHCPEITSSEFKSSVLHKHIRTLVVASGDHFINKLNANKILPNDPLKTKRLTGKAALSEDAITGETATESFEIDLRTVSPKKLRSVSDGTETEEQEEGGVNLLDHEYPDQKGGYQPLEAESDLMDVNEPPVKRNTHEQWPRLPGMAASKLRSMSITSSTTSMPRTDSVLGSDATSRRGGRKVYTESIPSLNSPAGGASVSGDEDMASEVTTTAASVASKPVAWTTGQTYKPLFKAATPTPPAGDWAALAKRQESALAATDKSTNLMYSRFYDPSAEDYDAEAFFNLTLERYLCPFPECDDQDFDVPSELAHHLNHAHLTILYACKICFKRFSSAKAQVWHMESAGGRCRVKDSKDFKKRLDEITGGFLKAKRLEEPFLYNKEKAVVRAGQQLTEGVLSVEYKAKLPHEQ